MPCRVVLFNVGDLSRNNTKLLFKKLENLLFTPSLSHSLHEFHLVLVFFRFVRSLAFVSVSFGLPSIGNCSSDCISDPTIFTMTLIPIHTHTMIKCAYISQAGNQFETNETIE